MQIIVLSVGIAMHNMEFPLHDYKNMEFPLHDYKNTAQTYSTQIPVSQVKVTYMYIKLLPITVTTEELES